MEYIHFAIARRQAEWRQRTQSKNVSKQRSLQHLFHSGHGLRLRGTRGGRGHDLVLSAFLY